VTDGRTDGQTDRWTEFSSLDRVCIACSAVIKTVYYIYGSELIKLIFAVLYAS